MTCLMSYVLIVDDDVDGRSALSRFLLRTRHEVACASNGREALQAILARTPDLVILDLFMPEMDGMGLLEVARSYLRLQTLPFLILSAYPSEATVRRARELHVDRVLTKGEATLQEILAAVNEMLTRPHSARLDPRSNLHRGA